ncbi:MAG: hypothetical protein CMJ44_18445 [Pimelobacter sp.]|nr:hypothetical protein [Pimelobacter sp.]
MLLSQRLTTSSSPLHTSPHLTLQEISMTTFRTALLALTVAFTIAGGAGAASQVDAAPTDSSIVKQVSARGGDSWCC